MTQTAALEAMQTRSALVKMNRNSSFANTTTSSRFLLVATLRISNQLYEKLQTLSDYSWAKVLSLRQHCQLLPFLSPKSMTFVLIGIRIEISWTTHNIQISNKQVRTRASMDLFSVGQLRTSRSKTKEKLIEYNNRQHDPKTNLVRFTTWTSRMP